MNCPPPLLRHNSKLHGLCTFCSRDCMYLWAGPNPTKSQDPTARYALDLLPQPAPSLGPRILLLSTALNAAYTALFLLFSPCFPGYCLLCRAPHPPPPHQPTPSLRLSWILISAYLHCSLRSSLCPFHHSSTSFSSPLYPAILFLSTARRAAPRYLPLSLSLSARVHGDNL